MRKTIFIITVFFLFMASSCKGFFNNSFDFSNEECITLTLPSWPPEDELQQNYPPLSRWVISVESEEKSSSICCQANEQGIVESPVTENGVTVYRDSVSINVRKNKPVGITVQPITGENSFFKPGGFIYPYDFNKSENSENEYTKNEITWVKGFLATLMQNIFRNKDYSKSELNDFILHFNWNKAAEIINSKMANNAEQYNPWLLNQCRLIETICSKKASSIYFNMSYTEEVPLSSLIINNNSDISTSPEETPPIDNMPTLLSSFIPENSNIASKKTILLKKQQPELIYAKNNKGIICTYYSINKISLEYILLPIYIEGI